MTQFDALTAARELFHVFLPKAAPVTAQTQEQLLKLAAQLAEKDTKLSSLFADKETLSAQLAQARQEN